MHHYSPTKIPSEFFTYQEIKQQLPNIFPSVHNATEILNQLKPSRLDVKLKIVGSSSAKRSTGLL